MSELYININWIAVLTSTVLAFGLGGLWYSPRMFGPRWARGSGLQVVKGHPVNALIVQLVGTFFMAWLIGIGIEANAYGATGLIILTIATVLAGGCLFSQKNGEATLIEFGFVLVNGAIMVACQLLL